MNFIQRLKYFLYGVFLGLILVIFFFGNRMNACSSFLKKNKIKEHKKLIFFYQNINIKNKNN